VIQYIDVVGGVGRRVGRASISFMILKSVSLKPVKRAGGMAQAVEHLSSEYKALRSNPSTAKKKKESWMCASSGRMLA
jgi:hypothetical protein